MIVRMGFQELIAGLSVIIWVALFYEADGAVHRVVTPIVKISVPMMWGVTAVVGLILWPLGRLLRMGEKSL